MTEVLQRDLEEERMPEMILSAEGYVRVKTIAKNFCTNLQQSTTEQEICWAISKFENEIGIYRWLCCFDMIALLSDIERFKTHDLTRTQLIRRTRSLINAVNGEIGALKGIRVV